MGLEKIDQDVCRALYHLQLTPNYKGFYQMAYAVWLVAEDSKKLLAVTKQLYPEIAEYCGTTGMAVERDIRTAVNVIWEKGRWKLEKLAGYPLRKKPSASQVISILVSALVKENI